MIQTAKTLENFFQEFLISILPLQDEGIVIELFKKHLLTCSEVSSIKWMVIRGENVSSLSDNEVDEIRRKCNKESGPIAVRGMGGIWS
ncbi:hypothetical protein DID78_07210 [Candidatus Marinamargulisbacteria bacterium SCGC AG-343-D04]|nr:hypothetical protein DID78_07210 [Candidatus Marinamargulisbacteria bacterium SCGC AG-343-D04]